MQLIRNGISHRHAREARLDFQTRGNRKGTKEASGRCPVGNLVGDQRWQGLTKDRGPTPSHHSVRVCNCLLHNAKSNSFTGELGFVSTFN